LFSSPSLQSLISHKKTPHPKKGTRGSTRGTTLVSSKELNSVKVQKALQLQYPIPDNGGIFPIAFTPLLVQSYIS